MGHIAAASGRQSGVPRRAGVLVAAALAVSLMGCERDADTQSTAAPPPPPAVTVATVERRTMASSTEFNGRIEAVDTVELRARVAGFLQQRLFEEGGDVKADQLCFVIEKAPYQASVNAAKADVQKAEARAEETKATAARFEQSVKSGAVSRLQYDEAVATRDVSLAEVMQKKAALERTELDLGYTDISCAVTGRIGRATYSVGNYVAPDSEVLATVVSEDPMYVTFQVSQRYILDIQKTMTDPTDDKRDAYVLRLLLGDGSVYPEPAKIDFAGIQISESTDTLAIRGTIPNPKRLLVDGQFVTVSVEDADPKQVLTIPQQALQADQGGPFVLVVGDDDKVAVKRITTGDSRDGLTAVTEGLNEGEKVIVEGVQKVRPGDVVQPSEMPAAKPDA